MMGSHFFDINYGGIGKYVIKVRLGTGRFALGMPPFSGGADSAENPLKLYVYVSELKKTFS
jgi:hypothetical protein